jgi:hypothetical protein
MAAGESAGTRPGTPAGGPPPQKSRRRARRRIVHGVLLVALAAGVFGLLPRLGGVTRDAAELRHARPVFVAAAIVAQAASLGSYALLYQQVLASLGRGCRSRWRHG